MSSRGQSSRPAFNGDALPVAIHVLAWHRRVFEGEAHVVRHEQIEMSIPVVVEETASRAPAWLRAPQTGGLGRVSKRSIAIIAIKALLPKIDAEDVFESVIVIVADANTGGPAYRLQSRFLGNIRKCSLAIALVKALRCARPVSLQAS